MNAKYLLFGAAVAGSAGAVFVAVAEARKQRSIEAKMVLESSRRDELRVALRNAQTAGAEKKPAATSVVEQANADQPKAPAPAFPPRTRPPGLMDFARECPELLNEFVESKRAELGRLYLPLLQRLNFSAAQRERFKEILATALARGLDIGAAADAKGLANADPVIEALRKESEARRTAELMDLFGPAGYPEFDRFERALPVRGFLDGFATQVAADDPLTGNQADQLERILAEATPAYRDGKRADPATVDWVMVDQQARRVLTPRQFDLWQLGVAHNRFGGSRKDQELQAVYKRAVERARLSGEGL